MNSSIHCRILAVAAAAVAFGPMGSAAFAFNLVPPEDALTNTQYNALNAFSNVEGLEAPGVENQLLDPELLVASGTGPIDVFFINEGAGFRNALKVVIDGDPLQTIFPDVASPASLNPELDGPLSLGEGRRLGDLAAGAILDFFIDTGNRIYGADDAENPDGLQHVIARSLTVEGDDFVLIGFEDLFGPLGATTPPNEESDRDFNDVVFAVRGIAGEPIHETPTGVPEPGSAIALLGLGLLGLAKRARRTA